MSDEVLVKVEGVSKKFCRSLKRSLWYGVQDVSAEMFGRKGSHEELRKNEFWAVNDVSFELKRGECLGLIGPNGAGKSTLLKMLNGLVKPDQGRITMRGRVGALIELGAGFNPILTARENIYINGSVLGFSKKEIDEKFDAIVDFAEIEEFIDTPVQNYSSGMKVRLGFAVAAQMEPDVLLIDEVLAVGDAGFIAKCLTRISELMKISSLILVSHSMPNISRLATHVLTLNEGHIGYLGPDAGKGIETLHSLFSFDTNSVNFSTPLAKLMKLEVESQGASDIAKLDNGAELILHLYCDVDQSIQSLSINILICDQSESPLLYSSSAYADSELVNLSTTRHLRVNLGTLLLRAGLYSIDVSITDKDNQGVLAKAKALNRFRVCSRYLGYAPMQTQAIWDWI